MKQTIGYVGLGSMGGALAERLMLTHALVVYDKSAATLARFVAQGASPAASLKEIAGRSDVLFLCLPTSQHVEAALHGEDGILAGARPGLVVIDQTTGDPTINRRLAAELQTRDITFIDAPVSGGPLGAQAGTIAIMVGGAPSAVTPILPILHDISPNVFLAGDIGAGNVAKLANNMLSAAQRLATMEAIALATKGGVDAAKALEIINAGAGRNFFSEKLFAPHILTGKLQSGFTLGLLHKDIRLACQLADDTAMPLLFGNLTKDFLKMAINAKGEHTQVHAVAVVMDEISGSAVVPADYTLE